MRCMGNLPKLRLLLHKLLHELLTLCVVQNHNLLPAALKVVLTTHEALVLAHNNALNLVEDASTGAHVARRQGGVHSSALVGRSGQTTGVLERGHLSL